MMEPYKKTELSGIFHSFTGTLEEAGQVLEYARFFFGINGVVTFKKSSLAEVLPHIPLDRIVLETDSPYLPCAFQGKTERVFLYKECSDETCRNLWSGF